MTSLTSILLFCGIIIVCIIVLALLIKTQKPTPHVNRPDTQPMLNVPHNTSLADMPTASALPMILGTFTIIIGVIMLLGALFVSDSFVLSVTALLVLLLGIVMMIYWQTSKTRACIEIIAKYLADQSQDD